MTQPEQPLPAANRSREEVARIEVGHTTVGATTVRVLVVGFLLAIAIVPFIEAVGARVGAERAASAWAHLSGLPGELRGQQGAVPAAADAGPWRRVVLANRRVLAALSAFERGLEEESLLGRSLRPPAQVAMTRWLGVGNERVYRGRDGWLFYRSDVEYVTGRGFLDPAEMRRRVAAASEWVDAPQPDPRAAIAQFKADLDARGITLIVVPTPLKPGIHPERLARQYEREDGALQNPSHEAFVQALQQNGVLVFDPSPVLAAERAAGPQYLATDTHWRPEAMELVAERLAAFLAAHVDLPAAPAQRHRLERVKVTSAGDTARMLDLPEPAAIFPSESVWVRRVLQSDGTAWRPSREADVLVLGDSFANIYALESLGWGTGAGLVEQLSYALRRPVDRIVQNDEGAFATRAMLRRDPARLAGKRVVIYQFAARELASGDWRVLPLE